MMRLRVTPAQLWLLALALSAPVVAGESLFDDDEVAAFKEKQADSEEPVGESLFDDDEVAAWKDKQGEDDEPIENAVTFNSKENALTADIAFDVTGKVTQGGSSDPDIAFYHVVELNGERFEEPTDGSSKLMELIEKGEDYEVTFAPPSFNQFQCTEKVESIEKIFEQYNHELSEELLQRAAAVLANEGIRNSKQLGEVDEKDFDAIMGLPALIKTRLRKVAAEAKKQAAVAAGKVEIDGKEVEDELKAFMAAREASKGDDQVNATLEESKVAAAADGPAGEQEEEDGTFKSLVWAVMNCPTCKGKETITCFRSCRYESGTKKTWSECLDECIENRWLRATFRVMLPSER